MPSFFVQSHNSLSTGDGRCPLLRPGDAVPEGMFTETKLEELVRLNHIRAALTPEEENLRRQHEAAKAADPKSSQPQVVRMGDLKDEDVAPGERIASPQGRWDLDPALIEGKGFDDLCVMILERDEAAELPTSIEAAIALLTKDFRKA